MKMMHLISSKGFFGAENVVVNLAKAQKNQGFDVWIGAFNDKRDPHLEIIEMAKKNNIQTVTFDCAGRFDLKTIGAIRKFITKNNMELVHAHGYKSNLYALAAGINTKLKKITTCHNWLAENTKMRIYEQIDKLFLKSFDKIVAVSEQIKTQVLKAGVDIKKVALINNGIDLASFKLPLALKRTDFNIGNDEKIAGTVGRLTKEKGHCYLLAAAADALRVVPELKILIVGEGPLKKTLQAQARDLKIEDKVIFTGIRDDIPQLLKLMDVFVLPSLIEGMPLALLEAMAAKVPVVTTDVGAVSSIVKDEVSGLLIPPRDSKAMSEAMTRLLLNKNKAVELADKGYEIVKRDFSVQKMASDYKQLYESIS
jgi:glycosyltransferase involved in cell wall biosynthesis